MNKIERLLLYLVLTALAYGQADAQQINGDLNHNNRLDVGDVTMLLDSYLSGTTETITANSEPYFVDNSLLTGTWYRSKSDSFTLNTDGTTDYGKGYTFKFMPSQGCILFFNPQGRAVSYLRVFFIAADHSYIVVKAQGTDEVQTYFNQPFQPVETIILSQTSLTFRVGSDPVPLTATVTPADADDISVLWESSNEAVVTVSPLGMVEAVSEGTATITCTALDGFGATAACEVTVMRFMPPGTVIYALNSAEFWMIPVSGGIFQMGSADSDANSDESPIHTVTLSDYRICETEVTQELWEAVMGSNPSYHKGDNLPVENVSWEDCQRFIAELNQLTGRKFRLPTEAEWEFAARGGNKSQGCKYSGSNTIDEVAWYGSFNKTHEVATKQPNELGLYDMSGNVREWCQDWYSSSSYTSAAQTNPAGPSAGTVRVNRGGSIYSTARDSRVSNRGYNLPDYAEYNLGFRLAQ